jgi:hypothetical protein
MNAHASGIERRWGAPIMSSFHAAFSVGGAAGSLLGGVLAHLSTTSVLGAASAIAVVTVAAASTFLRGGDRAPVTTPIAALDRGLLTLSLMALLCMMIEGAVADWSGTLLVQAGADIGMAAVGYIAFSACMVVGRLCGDWIISRLGAATIVRWGGAMAAFGLGLVAMVPGPVTGTIGFGLVGLGLSNVVPTVFSAAGRGSVSAATGVATAAAAGYGGFLLGPVAIGTVATLSNLQWGIAVLAVGAVMVSFLAVARRLRASN